MARQPPSPFPAASGSKGLGLRRFACALYAVALTVVSIMPNPRLPQIFYWSGLFTPDKIAHFGAYAVFAVLLSFAVGPAPPGRTVVGSVAVASVFGTLMEVLQAVSGTGRSFDYLDMIANLIGAVIGGLVSLLLLRIVFPSPAPAEEHS